MEKFKVYENFNLSAINRDMLEQWENENLFEQSMKVREGCPSFVFMKDLPAPMACLVYIMLWPVPSRTFSVVIRQ